MSIIEEITALSAEYYELVGKDHHKDRDCHWYIETKWSYGQPPKYIVRHHGYVSDEIEEEYNSFSEALVGLRFVLRTCVRAEKEFFESEEFAAQMEEQP